MERLFFFETPGRYEDINILGTRYFVLLSVNLGAR